MRFLIVTGVQTCALPICLLGLEPDDISVLQVTPRNHPAPDREGRLATELPQHAGAGLDIAGDPAGTSGAAGRAAGSAPLSADLDRHLGREAGAQRDGLGHRSASPARSEGWL